MSRKVDLVLTKLLGVAFMPLMGPAAPDLPSPDHIPFRRQRERGNYARTARASGRFFAGPPEELPCA